MSHRYSRFVLIAVTGIAFAGPSLLTGCGIGEPSAGTVDSQGSGTALSGILHGGVNPIIGATVTLYFTAGTGSGSTSAAYGAGAKAVASTTTNTAGGFTLSNPSSACPTGGYAYIGAYGGSSGTTGTNPYSLLMVPIGACSSNYASSSPYAYSGGSVWIDELTTAISAYALGNFMSLSNSGMSGAPPTCTGTITCQINIGAAASNTTTASTSTPSAAGLAHAFANALALMNVSTGQPTGYTNGGTSTATGGVVPDGEIFLVGNMLQSCVNSTGPTGANTASSNDGSNCGKLFSFVTPPQSGAAVPTNTLQAMLDLAKYPNPSLNTTVSPMVQNNWNSGCTAVQSSGTNTATSCLFALAAGNSAAYPNALTSAPPDWTLAVVYEAGYGAVTSGACTGTCPGLTYPYYVALDYADNAYVLNWSGGTPTWTNIVGLTYAGGSIFSSSEDTTNIAIDMIATDTAGHVFGANNGSASGENVPVYYTGTGSGTAGAKATTVTYNNVTPKAIAADPFNNIYIASATAGINLRVLTYTAGSPPTYVVSNATVTAPADAIYQIAIDANYDFYELEQSSSTLAYLAVNSNSSLTSAPVLNTGSSYNITASVSGSSTNAAGIAPAGTNAYVIDANGATPITKSGSGASTTIAAGTQTALPAVYNSTLYSRYAYTDGNNWVYSPDGANGSAVTGVSVFDSTDTLALGTYKGCYVISGACGTTAGSVPMYSPRGMAIDSAGDIWVVSGASANLTELIGAAAPTWPGLSLAKFGKPQ